MKGMGSTLGVGGAERNGELENDKHADRDKLCLGTLTDWRGEVSDARKALEE